MSDETATPGEDKFVSGKTHAYQAAEDFREAATQKAHELRHVASTKADEFRKVATDKANEYRGRAESAVAEARSRAKTIQDDSEKYIRENPLRAVGTAFFAGVVIGLLIRR